MSRILSTDFKLLFQLFESLILCRKELMAMATVTEEDYYVAPPGNIPLTPAHPDKYALPDSQS
jgi:hypothetical protein